MGLFSKKYTQQEMEKSAEGILLRCFETVNSGEMIDFPKCVNGKWEICFLINATRKLWDTVSAGKVVNVSFGLASLDSNGIPLVMELIRFDHRNDLSYGMIARPHILGEKKSPLESLNYFDILSNQQTITCNFKYDGNLKKGCTIRNPLYRDPQLLSISTEVDRSLAAKNGYMYYAEETLDMTSHLLSNAITGNDRIGSTTEYERMGLAMWNKYEGK